MPAEHRPDDDLPARADRRATVAKAAAELASILVADVDLDELLDRVARVGQRTIPGAADVSVTVLGETAVTVAHSGPLALDVDELQYATGQGPCLDAARTSTVVDVPDLAAEDRWPDYIPGAVGAGVASSVSIPLPIRDVSAALNVYARAPRAFDADAVSTGHTFATFAAAAITNATAYRRTAHLAEQLDQAMVSRAVIEQAKGMLMARRRCSAEEAFELLRSTSQRSGTRLRDVAQALVDGVDLLPR